MKVSTYKRKREKGIKKAYRIMKHHQEYKYVSHRSAREKNEKREQKANLKKDWINFPK